MKQFRKRDCQAVPVPDTPRSLAGPGDVVSSVAFRYRARSDEPVGRLGYLKFVSKSFADSQSRRFALPLRSRLRRLTSCCHVSSQYLKDKVRSRLSVPCSTSKSAPDMFHIVAL